MRTFFANAILSILIGLPLGQYAFGQDRIITVPKPVEGAPFQVEDSEDLFGKAYRWFLEGEVEWAADSLRKLLSLTDFKLDERNYYIVVANFTDKLTPIGLLHRGSAFTDTRIYGLTSDDLYYIFISKREKAESFLSVTLTAKDSPFQQNLLDFLSLFLPIPSIPGALGGPPTVWIDVRKFNIPEKFQKNSDISVIVKKELESDDRLASAIFDNTAKEHWSFGIATAITTINDLQFVIEDGKIVVEPKPFLDLAAFGVINYHFKAVDTKAPTLASSFHLLAGLRIDDDPEPLFGLGFGFPTGIPIEVHFFGGFSVQFEDELKSGFTVGQTIEEEVDPFEIDVRVRPRLGIELKFP
ncbi:hypothetical protein GWO43_31320 [candidate division KSB1 bacterium]|nr:hypothetical protein [candidate division KSB1 bacterium]NIR73392.1 hypothetical protein [candidate division KSB1 bacterium]NIS28391.1 hypothetical protein [candidate division KSB1 bacterium]NIT75272.1 hypothetical protein [candidate division KSB1 bacterium]NIU29119.1 hypothetical protein [candidate division KSB1 bacterium]